MKVFLVLVEAETRRHRETVGTRDASQQAAHTETGRWQHLYSPGVANNEPVVR